MSRAFWVLVAFTAIDGAVATYLAVYGVNAVSSVLLVGGLVAFLLAAAIPRQGASGQILRLVLLLVAAHLALRMLVPYRAEQPPVALAYQLLATCGLLALGMGILADRLRAGATGTMVALGVVIALGFVARGAIVLVDVDPPFDVPLIQEAAAAALRSGADPYLTHVYAAGYPYLPVSAVAAMLGSFVGDARWAGVAGDALTVAGIILAARHLGSVRALGWAAAALWSWSSGGLYIIWQGFPEPILTGFLALGVAFLVGRQPRPIIAGVMIGLAVGTKQFAAGVLPFLARTAKGRVVLAIALVASVACILPLAIWHPAAFAEGTFWSHVAEPGRPYALNALNWPGAALDVPLLLVLPVSLVVGWLVGSRFEDEDSAWMAASAALLLVAFLLNRIAFVNYYAIPLLLLLILMLSENRGARAGATEALEPSPVA